MTYGVLTLPKLSAVLLLLLLPAGGAVGIGQSFAAAQGEGPAVVLTIEGPIGPATSDYFVRGVERAAERSAALIVVRMDTPGGLDTAMREIIRAILAAPMPVVSFVAPSGARAASAGTYISYASHVAAMAPGTNLGAATPVQIGGPGMPSPAPEGDGGEESDDGGTGEGDADAGGGQEPAGSGEATGRRPGLPEKAINDAVAYIRSLAQLRDRNAEWAEKAVRQAASLSAAEALEADVIDLMADDVPDLLDKLDGRQVTVQGEGRTLQTADLGVEVLEPDWRTELLAIITNPNVAYILMLLGIYGLIFEFYSPGLFGPGIVGAICLVLALYAFQVLPVDYGGLALLLLGVALIIAETVTPSFGVLGVGGVAAFVIGSILLMDTEVPGFTVAIELIGAIALVAAGLLLLTVMLLIRSRKRAVVTGVEEMIGSTGRVLDWSGGCGRVRVHGELWSARAEGPLDAGALVRITALDGLTLFVEPAQLQSPPVQEPAPDRRSSSWIG